MCPRLPEGVIELDDGTKEIYLAPIGSDLFCSNFKVPENRHISRVEVHYNKAGVS